MKYWLYCLSLLFVRTGLAEQNVELLHWWTAKGEKAALAVIEETLNASSITVNSEPIAGGGGIPAKTILQARAIAGTPPDMALMEGPAIQAWAALGFLASVDEVADHYQWDENLYPEIKAIHKYQGSYVAIPTNIHRLNWMWINRDVLFKHQLAIPHDWDSLIKLLMTLKAKGVSPLALGDEPWQIVQLFENIAFSVGGPDYYRQAFIQLDPSALNSPLTVESLARFRTIADLVGDNLPNMSWDQGTLRLIEGKYAIQLTGDWALGEMLTHNNEIPEHIECTPFPSTHGGYIYNIDSLVFFRTQANDSDQFHHLSAPLASTQFMTEFNQKKGSIPAYKNVAIEGFSRCQKQSYVDYNQAVANNTAMPSLSDSMALDPVIQRAVSSELYRYFSDPTRHHEVLIGHLIAIGSGSVDLR
ncbi:ABC transporter substrate-binding protein [Thaumasiovibrio sp. DFM-14]|uniref:ABC transporter substrate-binding protein n=1 Tax=Thaumasiovibrio sp. DFM-14 TaxID=3384792 RepID=UPI0039A1FD55